MKTITRKLLLDWVRCLNFGLPILLFAVAAVAARRKARFKHAALFIGAFIGITGSTLAQVQVHPITAYTDILGPTTATTWVDTASGNFVVFDTWGKLNQTFGFGLGTNVSGNVTVRELGDGTQQVVIHVNTNGGLCWGLNANDEPALGFDLWELLAGVGSASVGRQSLRITQLPQPVGPIRRWPAQTIISELVCEGTLRSGSGYPDGSYGFAQSTQTGLGMTGVPSGCPQEHDANCWPAERIQFKPRGN